MQLLLLAFALTTVLLPTLVPRQYVRVRTPVLVSLKLLGIVFAPHKRPPPFMSRPPSANPVLAAFDAVFGLQASRLGGGQSGGRLACA